VADVLLAGRRFGDLGEGEVVFDEFSINSQRCLLILIDSKKALLASRPT
jgi:hypothetical protein